MVSILQTSSIDLRLATYKEAKDMLESHLKVIDDDIRRFEVLMNDDELSGLIGTHFKQVVEKLLTYYSMNVGEDCLREVVKAVPKLNALLVLQNPPANNLVAGHEKQVEVKHGHSNP